MDSESYLLGQALVGNVETAGALECTLLPPTLTVKGTCIVAFTGADMEPTINSVREYRDIFHLYVTTAMSFPAVLANVACACTFLSLEVIDVPSINGRCIDPYKGENWGP